MISLFFDSLFKKRSQSVSQEKPEKKQKIPLIDYSQRFDIFHEQPSMENLLNW